MKPRIRLLLIAVFYSFIVLPAYAEESASLYVGTGKTDITPAAGTPLAGYGKRKGQPSTGIHDPLYARALALSDSRRTLLILSADLVLIDAPLRREIIRKIQTQYPDLQESRILIAATHTHSGPGAIGKRFWERFIMGKFRRAVFDQITDQMAQAAAQALSQKHPAELFFGKTDISGLVQNRMSDQLLVPAELKVLKLQHPDGSPAAQIIFMPAHPTLFSKSSFVFSADFPGALCRKLETRYPDALPLLINGASGDLKPQTPDFPSPEDKIEAYAEQLADRIRSMNWHPIPNQGPLAAAYQQKKLPRVKIRAGWLRVPSLIGNRFFPRKAAFQTFRIHGFILTAFPGELGSETAHEIELWSRAYRLEPLMAGYANDYLGYVIPRRFYLDRAQYESQASFYGKKMDGFVIETFRRQIESLLTPEELSILNPPGEMIRKNGLPVLKLAGDPYHRGYEEGRLLAREIREGTRGIFRYFRSELPLPLLNRLVINFVLDRAWKKMEPYVSYQEYLQMKGVADGAGLGFRWIKRIHAMPEVYPTWCANGAYWGKATRDGNLIAIRNLDWNRKIGVHKFAAVKFHSMPGEIPYANIGYWGFIGALSGMNQEGISVGQIGAESSDETLRGVPMPFLLKRLLAETQTLEEAKKIFQKSSLTRGYNYVIGSAKEKKALAVETTARHLAFFQDQDPQESEVPYAERLASCVLRSDTALDPVIRNLQWASQGNPKQEGLEPPGGSAYEIRYKKHAELIRKQQGQMDVPAAREIAKEIAPGSNIQSVIYAYPEFYVANAKDDKRAVDEEYIHFDINAVSDKR